MAEIKIPLPTNEQIQQLIDRAYNTSNDSIKTQIVNRIEAEVVGYKKDYIIMCNKSYTDFALNVSVNLPVVDTSIYKKIEILVSNTCKADASLIIPQISMRNRYPESAFMSYLNDSDVYTPIYRLSLWGTLESQYEPMSHKVPKISEITIPQLEIIVRFATELTSGRLLIVLIGEK